jgi:tetratricopeptide (TPR) repeat protein
LRANLESIRGRYQKALEILKPALEEARTTGDLRLLASVLGQLGRVSMWLADEAAAVKYIGEALELSRKVGDKEALIFNLRQMGNALVQTKPSESRKYHEESVQLARQVGDKYGEAHGLNSLAIAFQLEGNSDKAMAMFLESHRLNRERGDRLNESMVLGNLAGLYSAAGDLETAERSARESMAIAKEIGAVSLLPLSQTAMAEICLRRGRDTEALQWIRTTGETIRSMGVPMTLVTLLYGIHKIRSGDRASGLAWVGFARAHDPNKMEIAALIRSFWPLIRGDASEDEVEETLRAGEGLKLEEILEEAEREG